MGIKFRFKKEKEEKPVLKIRIGSDQKPKKEGFIINWQNALGYRSNPFENKIFEPVEKFIAGLEKERHNLNIFIIKNRKFGTISGPKGIGKTTLLKWLYNELNKHKVLCRYTDESIKSFENSLKESFRFKDEKDFVNILKQKLGNKQIVLLIDNFDKITKEKIKSLENLYDNLNLQLIIASNDEINIQSEKQEFKDWLKIKIRKIPYGNAKEMIRKRIEHAGSKGIHPFDDPYLRQLWEESNGNAAKFLDFCKNHAIDLAVKTSEGMELKDAVTYQKEGVDLEKLESGELGNAEKTEKTGKYKIKPVGKKYKDIVIEDVDKHEEEKEYKIKATKKE